MGLTRNYLNYTKRQTVMNPYLSQEYSRAHRQDLHAESSQRRTYRQVARFGRAARRAQRAEQRARRAAEHPKGRDKASARGVSSRSP